MFHTSKARCVFWTLLGSIFLVNFFANAVRGDEPPLHERIDRLVEANSVGPVAANASDADFVRRIWLDLAGCVPSSTAARQFLENSSPNKRVELIDQLLASPQFVRHFTTVLDVTLMERRPEKAVKNPEWQQYLFESLAAEKPLDQLFRELIAADGVQASPRAAVRFLLDRDCEPNTMTRDIGRLVFGRDIQCAQCHDHPLIEDYSQAEYYGVQAFVLRSTSFNDAKNKQLQIAEKAEGEVAYQSVFTKTGSERTFPRLPLGRTVVDPAMEKGDEYVVAPAKDVRHVPKYSRRAQLAASLADSEQFRRNLANRVWAMVMGRGLVHPLDGHQAGNAPTHPQVLSLLADELAARKFNLKSMLRELVLTRTYQRSCDPPSANGFDFAALEGLEKTLLSEQEQLTAAVTELTTQAEQQTTAWRTATAERTKRLAELAPLEAAIVKARQDFDKVNGELSAAKTAVTQAQVRQQAVVEAAAKTKAAAEAIKDDQVLADAAAKIAERAAAQDAAVKAANDKVVAVTASMETALQPLTAARTALMQAKGAFPPDDAWLALEQGEQAAIRKKLAAAENLALATSRLAQVKALREYQALLASDPAMAAKHWERLIDTWTIRGQVGSLRPLSAEQLTFSFMQSANVLDPQRVAAVAVVDKTPPDELKNAADADKAKVREKLAELKLLDQVRGPVSIFVGLYEAAAGQEFQATANQALFLGNNGQLLSWITPAAGSLVERLSKTEEPTAVADELYLAAFSRRPTAAEQQTVTEFLAERKADRVAAIQEMVWGLFASNEFRFNH